VLDPLFHQPARTRIAAFLAAREAASFSELKRATALTDGNLDAHLKKLLEAGYVDSRDLPGDGRPQTAFALTGVGRRVFEEYVEALRELLGFAPTPAPSQAAGAPGGRGRKRA
jgi:DNA-binding MarR family transcriptional regulator